MTRSRTAAITIAMTLAAIPLVMCARPIALGGIHLYQLMLAPLAERAGITCRFAPSCSHYAAAVIARDGVARGSWLALKRIARCNPTTPMGTVDGP